MAKFIAKNIEADGADQNDYFALSVGQAIKMVESAEDNKTRQAIVQEVLSSEKIRGDADDYHNLAVTFTKDFDDYVNGFAIVEKGLEQFPNNMDLLADAIYYGSSAGEYQKCEEYVSRLNDRPMALWNWRAFSFLIDYYLDKADWAVKLGEDIGISEYLELTEKALTLAVVQQAVLSGGAEAERGYIAEFTVRSARERIYRADAKLKQIQGNLDDAKKMEALANEEREMADSSLEDAIDSGTFAAAGCCLKLAGSYFDRQNYKKTIEICNKALSFVQTQPSVRTGYFMYLIALSEDALIHEDNCFEDDARIHVVYQDYVGAYKTSEERSVYRKNIKDRVSILSAKTGVEIPALFQEDDSSALRRLLSQNPRMLQMLLDQSEAD